MKSILAAMAFVVCGLMIPLPLTAQQRDTSKRNGVPPKNSLTADLASLAGGKGGSVVNRSASVLPEGPRKGIRLDERPGDGLLARRS